MAGKDKPLKDAVKALGTARDDFAAADAAEAKAVEAALHACQSLGMVSIQLASATAAAKLIDEMLEKLDNAKAGGDAAALKKNLRAWLRPLKDAVDKTVAAETARLQREQASADLAAADLDATSKNADAAFTVLREAIARIPADAVVPAQPAKLPDELLRVIRGGKDDRSNYLTITQRDQRFDPLVRDTLGQLGKESRDKFEPELIKKIVAEGLASDVEKITRRINRMGMPDLRRSVLAETYAELLDEALDEGAGLSRERAEDTVGTGEAVLAALDGKLDRFAGILATRTATALGLDAPDGSYSHSIIKARVLGQI